MTMTRGALPKPVSSLSESPLRVPYFARDERLLGVGMLSSNRVPTSCSVHAVHRTGRHPCFCHKSRLVPNALHEGPLRHRNPHSFRMRARAMARHCHCGLTSVAQAEGICFPYRGRDATPDSLPEAAAGVRHWFLNAGGRFCYTRQ